MKYTKPSNNKPEAKLIPFPIKKPLVEYEHRTKCVTKFLKPWGYYEVLIEAKGFKVKKMVLKPNSSISVQSHNKREEHWVVVSGVANVLINDISITLKQGESIKIEKTDKHSLTNNQDYNLVVIETQTGEYLGEDDIVRYQDFYGRV